MDYALAAELCHHRPVRRFRRDRRLGEDHLDFLRRFEIPAELQEDRCGITYFQHPDIKVALKAMSQEERLLELIDESFWPEDATAGAGDFKGNASKVEQQLLHGSVRESASKLLYFSGSAGTYLARLAEREDGRVTYKTGRGGQREYIITHPTHPGTPGNRTTISPESLERVNQRNI